jgi:hypothetical protein
VVRYDIEAGQKPSPIRLLSTAAPHLSDDSPVGDRRASREPFASDQSDDIPAHALDRYESARVKQLVQRLHAPIVLRLTMERFSIFIRS